MRPGGSRNGRNAYSSLAQSVASYMPRYAPPVAPATDYTSRVTPLTSQMDSVGSTWDQHSRFVNRDPRRLGIRTLFSYGAQAKRYLFRNIATGAVESTKFQPLTMHEWNGEFNDAIFGMGYPRNLGLTVKVETVNKNINPPWTQTAPPNFRGRSVYVPQRQTTSGIPGVPARGQTGKFYDHG